MRQTSSENNYFLRIFFTDVVDLSINAIFGGLADAVELAADLAGLEGEPEVVRPRERHRGFISDLLTGVLGDLGQEMRDAGVGPRLMYIYR
jgi:hypothetical protein